MAKKSLEQQAREIVAAGEPTAAPATASLEEYKAASVAIRRYRTALQILEVGAAKVQAQAAKAAAARRHNGCGCDNAPDCLCR